MEKEKRYELIAYTIVYGWVGCLLFMVAISALMFFQLLVGWPSLKFVIKGFVLACILNIPTFILDFAFLVLFIGFYISNPYEIVDAFSRWKLRLRDC